jgi:hypothetical protein
MGAAASTPQDFPFGMLDIHELEAYMEEIWERYERVRQFRDGDRDEIINKNHADRLAMTVDPERTPFSLDARTNRESLEKQFWYVRRLLSHSRKMQGQNLGDLEVGVARDSRAQTQFWLNWEKAAKLEEKRIKRFVDARKRLRRRRKLGNIVVYLEQDSDL